MTSLRIISIIASIIVNLCWFISAKSIISVKVLDSLSNQQPDSLTLTVTNASDSIVFSHFEPSRVTEWNGRKSVSFGDFGLPVNGTGDYNLRLSAVGFCTIDIPFTLESNDSRLDLGTVHLDKEIALDEVEIVASKVKMVMAGDTIVYNATAFQLADGSMLDKLIEQLPGAKLNAQGQITVNGEFVSSLLINGKDFFSGNPVVALQNLPAYTVNQVQVYRREGDSAYLRERTEADRKSDPLVMDVKLKKEFMGMYMANADFATGTHKRYSARGFLSRFDDLTSIGIYGNVNNVGAAKSPQQNENIWNANALMTDETTYRTGGVDLYNSTNDRRRVFDLLLTGFSNSNHNETWTNSTHFLPENVVYYSRSLSDSKLTQGGLNLILGTQFRFKKIYSLTRLEGGLGRTKSHGSSNSRTNSGDDFLEQIDCNDTRFINRYLTATRGTTSSWNIRGYEKMEIRMPYNKDILHIQIEGTHNRDRLTQWSVSNRVSSDVTAILNDYNHSPKHRSAANASAQYEHVFPIGLTVKPGYEFRWLNSNDRRDLSHYLPDSIMEQIPAYTDTITLTSDLKQSYISTTINRQHIAKVDASVAFGKVNLELNLPLTWIGDRMADTRANTIYRNSIAFDPKATVRWKWFTAEYLHTTTTPSATQLLDFVDDSNLMTIRKGNPHLTNAHTNQGNIRFSKLNTAKQQEYRFNVSYSETKNALVDAVDYNPLNGVTTLMTHNVDGNRFISASTNYYQGFGAFKRWMFNGNIGTSLNRSVAFSAIGSDLMKSIVNSTNLSTSFSLKYTNDRFSLRGFASMRELMTHGNLDSFIRTNGFNGTFGINGWVKLPVGFYVETAISYFVRTGYSDPTMNKNSLIWNTSVQNSFGAKKEWIVRLDGFDIFGQLSNINRIINAQGITETRRNTIGQYFLLHIQYMFSFSKQSI